MARSRSGQSESLKAWEALHRAHARLHVRVRRLLRGHGLSLHHYEALEVLAADPGGELPSLEIGARMPTEVPDITRLLDRVAALGYAARERSETDRRVVHTKLLPAGRRLVRRVQGPLQQMLAEELSGFSTAELRTLRRLLGRAGAEPD